MVLQGVCRRLAIVHRFSHHNKGLQRHSPVGQFDRKHDAFTHVRMIEKAALHLDWIDPLAGNFDQVVLAAAEEVESVAVAHKTIAGAQPAAFVNGLRGSLRPVPKHRRAGMAANPHRAFAAVGDLSAGLVLEHNFVARYAHAGGAGLLAFRTIR